MALWDFFNFGKNTVSPKLTGLPLKLEKLLPEFDDQERAKITAISGLLACVAQSDFHISEAEQSEIEKSLSTWCKLSAKEAHVVAQLASEEVSALASLEVHTYTGTLEKLLSEHQRVEVLEALFQLAASDGEVAHEESEFIRHVSHGFKLSHHEFIAARATVLQHLKVLQNS